MTFADALRAAIEPTGLSLVEVARQSGISKDTIYSWVNGHRSPDRPNERLYAILGAPHLREYVRPRGSTTDPLIADLRRRRMPAPTRIDDELGPVRLCSGCETEWPVDEEFFWRNYHRCRACETEIRQDYWRRNAA